MTAIMLGTAMEDGGSHARLSHGRGRCRQLHLTTEDTGSRAGLGSGHGRHWQLDWALGHSGQKTLVVVLGMPTEVEDPGLISSRARLGAKGRYRIPPCEFLLPLSQVGN